MHAELSWNQNIQFTATTDSGHSIVMDGSPDAGGQNAGARPMEMLLIGMGGCTGIDVVMILKKSRVALKSLRIKLDAERADRPPMVFTKIHVHFIVEGDGLKPELVERAIKLSAEKYCSASIMLGQTAKITHDFEIVGAA
jgi:putative redox protein